MIEVYNQLYEYFGTPYLGNSIHNKQGANRLSMAVSKTAPVKSFEHKFTCKHTNNNKTIPAIRNPSDIFSFHSVSETLSVTPELILFVLKK